MGRPIPPVPPRLRSDAVSGDRPLHANASVKSLDTSMKKVNEQNVERPELRHLRLSRVLEIVSVGERTWLRWVKAGKAPAPVRLGERAVAWRLSEIREWLDSRPVVGGAE